MEKEEKTSIAVLPLLGKSELLPLPVFLQETGAGFLARVLPNKNAATFSSWFLSSLCLRVSSLVLQAGGKAFCIVRESLLFSGRSNIQLPQGFVEDDGDGVGKIEGSDVFDLHGNGQNPISIRRQQFAG